MRALLCAAAALLTACPAAGAIVWDFEEGDSGWRVADMSCGGAYKTPLSYRDVTWAGTGGSPGGCIYAHDPTSNCFFFDAPAASLGDLSGYAGGLLEFSLKSTVSNWASDNAVVFVGANGTTLVGAIVPIPGTEWRSYVVRLLPSSFRRNGLSGTPASASDMNGVLANVTALRISAEFGAAVQETTSLDSVRILPPTGPVGIRGAHTQAPIMSEGARRFMFRVWGRVSVVSPDSFDLDDGSGAPVRVTAAAHGLSTGTYAVAEGILNAEGAQPVLDTAYGTVSVLAP